MLVIFFIFLFFKFVIKKNFCKAIILCFIKRNHVSIRNWIQKYFPKKLLSSTKRKIDKYIVGETMVKIGSELVWLWVVIETKNKSSFNDHIKRKEYACSQTFSVKSHRRALQTLCFNRDGERAWGIYINHIIT